VVGGAVNQRQHASGTRMPALCVCRRGNNQRQNVNATVCPRESTGETAVLLALINITVIRRLLVGWSRCRTQVGNNRWGG